MALTEIRCKIVLNLEIARIYRLHVSPHFNSNQPHMIDFALWLLFQER